MLRAVPTVLTPSHLQITSHHHVLVEIHDLHLLGEARKIQRTDVDERQVDRGHLERQARQWPRRPTKTLEKIQRDPSGTPPTTPAAWII